jgi:hypothetical protein
MSQKYLFLLLVIAIRACEEKKPEKPVESVTVPVTNITPSQDQQERRARSEEYCKRYNIPVYKNPNSLFVDPESKVTLRTSNEIVDRSMALLYVGLKSEGLEQSILDRMDSLYSISSKLSPEEKSYATATHPTQQQKTDANWRYECLHVMLWALGYIDSLSYPDKMCDVAKDVKIIRDLGAVEFRKQAKLRSKQEILDQADLILRLDWACVSARVKNVQAPGNLYADIVTERHRALNWLIRYMDQAWDDVSMDT